MTLFGLRLWSANNCIWLLSAEPTHRTRTASSASPSQGQDRKCNLVPRGFKTKNWRWRQSYHIRDLNRKWHEGIPVGAFEFAEYSLWQLTTDKRVLFQPSLYVLRRPQNLNEAKFVQASCWRRADKLETSTAGQERRTVTYSDRSRGEKKKPKPNKTHEIPALSPQLWDLSRVPQPHPPKLSQPIAGSWGFGRISSPLAAPELLVILTA